MARARHTRPARTGGDLVSKSPAMQRVLELADRAARSEATVLITGESGTARLPGPTPR